VHENAYSACNTENGRRGECGDDDDAIPDVVYPVAQKDAVGIDARVRMVSRAGVVVMVKMREIAESHKHQDGSCDDPREAERERPRVFDDFLRESVGGNEKNARRETHKKVQVALDERPRLTPRDELARKRGKHNEE